jgi:hypothetical protein
MRLQSRTREMVEKKKILSDGSLLWWEVVLLDWLFPLVRHGLGGFSLKEEDKRTRNDRKCMRVDLQSTRGAILLAVRAHRE